MLRGWGHQRLLFLCDVKAPYFPGDEGHHVVIFRPHPTHAIMNSLHTTRLAILRFNFLFHRINFAKNESVGRQKKKKKKRV